MDPAGIIAIAGREAAKAAASEKLLAAKAIEKSKKHRNAGRVAEKNNRKGHHGKQVCMSLQEVLERKSNAGWLLCNPNAVDRIIENMNGQRTGNHVWTVAHEEARPSRSMLHRCNLPLPEMSVQELWHQIMREKHCSVQGHMFFQLHRCGLESIPHQIEKKRGCH